MSNINSDLSASILFFLSLLLSFHFSFCLAFSQCGVHLDQPPGGGGGAGGVRAGGPGPGCPGHQRSPGGALPHRGSGGGGRPRRHPHQLQRGEAAHAPQRRVPGRPAGPHICGLQHVRGPSSTRLITQRESVWLLWKESVLLFQLADRETWKKTWMQNGEKSQEKWDQHKPHVSFSLRFLASTNNVLKSFEYDRVSVSLNPGHMIAARYNTTQFH